MGVVAVHCDEIVVPACDGVAEGLAHVHCRNRTGVSDLPQEILIEVEDFVFQTAEKGVDVPAVGIGAVEIVLPENRDGVEGVRSRFSPCRPE